MATLVKNARIVADMDIVPGDLLIKGGRVERIDAHIPAGDAEVIDARGQFLLPGGVDVHTHFDLDLGAYRATDTFYTGTAAAACGGTTTVVDHLAFGPDGCRLGRQIDVYRQLAKDSVVDYSFHGVVQHVDDLVLADMEELAGQGITSHKIYLTYGHKLGDADALRVLDRARELGLVVCVHCENDAIVGFLAKRLAEAGLLDARGHPRSRPDYCEAEAVQRMLALAHAAGDAPLYVVHLSCGMSLDATRDARGRGQANVFAETCPQYLLLDKSRYENPEEGLKYIMSPPLRTPVDNEALWEGLRRGDIDAVATDHCPFFFNGEKQAGKTDFRLCPGGIPGVETRMPLMLSEGYLKGRLTLPEVTRLCCSRPARIFGLYPRKGVLQPGSDADMFLFDPDVEWTLTQPRLHERTDYTPYEGRVIRGAPTLTISRGEIVAKNGVFAGRSGHGRFIKRERPDLEELNAR